MEKTLQDLVVGDLVFMESHYGYSIAEIKKNHQNTNNNYWWVETQDEGW